MWMVLCIFSVCECVPPGNASLLSSSVKNIQGPLGFLDFTSRRETNQFILEMATCLVFGDVEEHKSVSIENATEQE